MIINFKTDSTSGSHPPNTKLGRNKRKKEKREQQPLGDPFILKGRGKRIPDVFPKAAKP